VTAWIRQRSGWVAGGWLLSQIAVAVLTAVVLVSGSTAASAAGEHHCECPGSTSTQTCPMHHDAGSTPASEPLSNDQCAMRGCPSPAAAVVPITTIAAILPPVPVLHTPHAVSAVVGNDSAPTSRSAKPDGPPPRA
jgi:hypothetical protein